MARYLKINGKVCLDTLRDTSRPCLFIACCFLVSAAKIHFFDDRNKEIPHFFDDSFHRNLHFFDDSLYQNLHFFDDNAFLLYHNLHYYYMKDAVGHNLITSQPHNLIT